MGGLKVTWINCYSLLYEIASALSAGAVGHKCMFALHQDMAVLVLATP